MKNSIKIIAFIVIVFSLISCGEQGTVGLIEYGDLKGRVVEKDGFKPLENVKVTLSPTNNTTFTDAEGNFKFTKIEAKEYSVQATKEGFLDKFESASVTKESTVNVVLELDISTALNQAPSKPALTSPEDGTEGLNNKVELVWSSEDKDKNDKLVYKIEIKNNYNSDVIIIEDYKETTYTLSDLKFGGKYFWQVRVTDGINEEVLSETQSFTIKEDPGNRYFFIKNVEGNSVIYSSSYSTTESSAVNMVMLTEASKNSWRPRKNNTANLIAFLRTENNQTHLYTMKVNGDEVKKVTSLVPIAGFNPNEVDFSWSPDGSKLLYPNFDKLYSINKDGTGLELVYQTTDGSLITECDWGTGNKIAIKTNNSSGYNGAIYVIDTSGNIVHTVITGSLGALGGINLSASGNKLLYTKDISDFQSSNYRQLDARIFIYDIAVGTAIDLSSNNKISGTNDLDPRFSPNEAEVIFVNTSNDGVSQKNIVKTNTSGTAIQRVSLFTDATMPDWE